MTDLSENSWIVDAAASDRLEAGGIDIHELPPEVASEHMAERVRRGGLANLHPWWARRTSVLGRLSVLSALVETLPDDRSLLASLSKDDSLPSIRERISTVIRDAQWRWAWRDAQHAADLGTTVPVDPPALEKPRILDPFSGGGTFSMEAARLGCAAVASDLSPLAYHIMQAGLRYPSLFGQPNPEVPGTSAVGTWAGLADELTYWLQIVQDQVWKNITHLFPLVSKHDQRQVDVYLWFQLTHCVSCHSQYPTRPYAPGSRRRSPEKYLHLVARDGSFDATIEDGTPPRQERHLLCPFCGNETPRSSMHVDVQRYSDNLLAAVILEGEHSLQSILPFDRDLLLPWTDHDDSRLSDLLQRTFDQSDGQAFVPDGAFRLLHKCGFRLYTDLFSPRQKLVALEYIDAITNAQRAMEERGLLTDRCQALVTYLAFFVGYVVEHNSRLSDWNDPYGRALSQAASSLPAVWVERHPQSLVGPWLKRMRQALESLSNVPPSVEVGVANATSLPWIDASFDAIATDPPFYDAVPYNDLAMFYWTWERCILGPYTPQVLANRKAIASEANNSPQYRETLLAAFRESLRVLKPGRIFAMALSPRIREHFTDYVELAQAAGFDLVNVLSLPDDVKMETKVQSVHTFIVLFRRPFVRGIRPSVMSEAANLDTILAASANGTPILYEGLARVLLDNVPEEDIQSLTLPDARGTLLERVMEALASKEPRALLSDYLGKAGLRRVAKELGILDSFEPGIAPVDAILRHFGFHHPVPSSLNGPKQVVESLDYAWHRLESMTEGSDIRGLFLTASTEVENLLRLSIWGWATIFFKDARDSHLQSMLATSEQKTIDLSRLTFGRIAVLFRELPDYIKKTEQVVLVKQKFDRDLIYFADKKSTKYATTIDKILTQRNRMEHNKQGYLSNTSVHKIKHDCLDIIKESAKLVRDMADESVVPRIARVTHSILDEWGRTSYRLLLDNGASTEVLISTPLQVGTTMLYFGTGTNPRPVDPFYLKLSDLGVVPDVTPTTGSKA